MRSYSRWCPVQVPQGSITKGCGAESHLARAAQCKSHSLSHSPNTIPRKHAFSVLSVRECDLRAASRVLHAAASENGATGARSNLSAALIKLIHLLSTVNTMRSRKPRTLHNNILASRVYYFRAERHRCGGWVL